MADGTESWFKELEKDERVGAQKLLKMELMRKTGRELIE